MTPPPDDDTLRGIGGESADAGHAPTLPGRPSTPSAEFPQGTMQGAEPALPDGATLAAPTAPGTSGAMRKRSESLAGTTSTPARYRMGSRIGLGGMGEVILAFDEHIGREVAVKRVLAAQPSEDERARFWREARVQGRLEHPAVVPVHDLGVDADGRPYFVMKRLAGEPMADVLKRIRARSIDTPRPTRPSPPDTATPTRPLSVAAGDDAKATALADRDIASTRRRLLRAFVDVCLAIELAHSRGVVHRDLKPANIMLGDFGEVYVIDWGVARIVDNLGTADTAAALPEITEDVGRARSLALTADLASGETRTGSVMGTPAYMAPEQLAGEIATFAADVYALGCVLFEIVAGEPLHSRARSAVRAVDGRPTSRRSDAPPELDAICQRATELDPAARFPSSRTLADAVQAFLDGDRDVAVRRELAAHHLARAVEAIGKADTSFGMGAEDKQRSVAMAEAGRALALDPESADAALLVTQLMVQPPKRTPPEVEARLGELDVEAARFQGRLAALAMIGYLCFLPFLVWTGVRDWAHIAAFVGVVIAGGVQVFLLARGKEISTAGIYLNAAINALVIAVVSRIVGPFLIAPTLVMTTLVAYAVHPRLGRIWIIACVLASGLAIPWLLEIVGVLRSTYSFTSAGTLVIESPAIAFTSLPVQLAFVALLVALIVTVALLSRTLAMRQRDVTRKIELQAWQLRQLVPAKTN